MSDPKPNGTPATPAPSAPAASAPAGAPSAPVIGPDKHDHRAADPLAQRVWDRVSRSPLSSLWNLEGVPIKKILKRTGCSFMDDNLLSRAAELGYYFLFALFPTLVTASSILGLAARHASDIYVRLLNYLALVVPHSAYQMVIQTFNQTTAAASSGKLTLGLVAALWSASVGFSAIQDGMNTVYKVKETRPYWKARGSAILVTLLLSLIVTANLGVLFGGDLLAHLVFRHVFHHWIGWTLVVLLHGMEWIIALGLTMLLFSTIYYFAPDLRNKKWQWLTPGASIGIATWVLASLGLRLYLHYFNSYSVTYGSLGAVIILLTWFYVTGLTLLLGAEVNSEIHAAVAEKELKAEGALPPHASPHPEFEKCDPAPGATPQAAASASGANQTTPDVAATEPVAAEAQPGNDAAVHVMDRGIPEPGIDMAADGVSASPAAQSTPAESATVHLIAAPVHGAVLTEAPALQPVEVPAVQQTAAPPARRNAA